MMNRGALQSSTSSVQMMGGSLWSLDNMRPAATTAATTLHPQQLMTYPLPLLPSSSASTPSSSSSSSAFAPPYSQNILPMMIPCHDNQELPESWSQLLLGGLVEEEDRCSFTPYQTKKMENWEDLVIYPSAGAHTNDIKKELPEKRFLYSSTQAARAEEIQPPRSSWSQINVPNSSPRSCVTTSLNSSMLDFSNSKSQTRLHHQLDNSSQECNSTPTGSPYKKARVQSSSAQSTFKVRKEKLGDRITALHQLVSPFGKTDTASVLLEAIGYIRFLQGQIEALSSPYLATASANTMQHHPARGDQRSCIFPEDPGQLLNDNCINRRDAPDQINGADNEPKKDLRSRGLCLVPVSFTLHVGSDNGADYWAPTFGGGFR